MPASLTDALIAERSGVVGRVTVEEILDAKPAPTAPTDHATTDTYFYFGWASKNGGWLVRRQTRSTGLLESADVSNNSSVTAYADAWAARATLTYGSV